MYHVHIRNIELMIILNTLHNKFHSTISADYIYFLSDIIIKTHFLLDHWFIFTECAELTVNT